MVGARQYKCCGIYFPSKIQPLHPNVIDNEDDEKTGSNVRVQDPADDGMPIITGIIEFLYYPWEEEIQIQILCSMHGKGWRACIETYACVFTRRESHFSIFLPQVINEWSLIIAVIVRRRTIRVIVRRRSIKKAVLKNLNTTEKTSSMESYSKIGGCHFTQNKTPLRILQNFQKSYSIEHQWMDLPRHQ